MSRALAIWSSSRFNSADLAALLGQGTTGSPAPRKGGQQYGTAEHNLATVCDATENDFIHTGAVDLLAGTEVWLGGSDAAEQGVWRWSDGDVFWRGTATGSAESGAYVKWAVGQPSDGAGEDCTEIRAGSMWNDVSCDQLRAFVCEGKEPP